MHYAVLMDYTARARIRFLPFGKYRPDWREVIGELELDDQQYALAHSDFGIAILSAAFST